LTPLHAFIASQGAEGRRQNLLGDKICKMMSAKILLKILIFSAWLTLAFGLSQSDKVVGTKMMIGDTFGKMSYIFLKI
jgi:hypothetical protein